MPYGLTSEGFVPKPLAQIRADIEAAERANIDPLLDMSDDEPLSQINGIMAAHLAELWEVAQAVHAANDPNGASGEALANIANLTGTTKLPATKGLVALILVGTNGTVVEAGSIVKVTQDGGSRWLTVEDATIATVPVWAISTAYATGDVVSHAGNVYVCIDAGESAGSGGPTGTSEGITDNTVTWSFAGAGAAAVFVTAEAEEAGLVVAYAYSITTIVNAVAGWSSVLNLLDAVPGRDEESDAALRIRRELELQTQGAGALDAIRADLLHVPDVTTVRMFENVTDVVDGDGLPAHSVQAVVRGGDADAIRAKLFASVSAGTQTYGAQTGTVVDEQGDSHTLNFDRPTEKTVYVDITVEKTGDYPADGDTQIKDALLAWALANLDISDEVVRVRMYAPAFSVPGVADVPVLNIGFTHGGVAATNLAIGTRELAVFDSTRIFVTTV